MLALVATMIVDTFMNEVGKWQLRSDKGPRALYIKFRTKIDYDKEEGYRWAELIIYAPMNYVQVWVRASWNTIAIADMEADGDEMVPKEGKDYVRGNTDWTKIADHDSCWDEGLRGWLKDNEYRIIGFSGGGRWFKVFNPPAEIEDAKPTR